MNTKNKFIILFFLLFIVSCLNFNKTNYSKLKKFINKNSFNIENYDNVMVISEKGCVNCNKSFALLVQEKLKSNRTLFIVSAQGNTVDISLFLKSKNTILDYENKFSDLNIVENSSAIFLKHSKIDTVVNIKAKGIQTTLEYINSRM